MKNFVKIPSTFVLAISSLSFSFFTFAENLQFDTPIMRGTGCKPGTYSVTVAPDGSAISILFDKFAASVPQVDADNDNDDDSNDETTGKSNVKVSHKVCNMVIAALIPAGMKIESMDVSLDFRGFARADEGTASLFRTVLLERQAPGLGAGGFKRTLIEEKNWKNIGPLIKPKQIKPADPAKALMEDFTITTNKTISINSKCANVKDKQVKFRVKNVLASRIGNKYPNDGRSSEITLDSVDIAQQMIKYKLNLKSCR